MFGFFLASGSFLRSSFECICVHLKSCYQTALPLFSTHSASLAQHFWPRTHMTVPRRCPPWLSVWPDWPLKAAGRLPLLLWLCYCLLLSVNASPEQKFLLLLESSLFLILILTMYRKNCSANIPPVHVAIFRICQNPVDLDSLLCSSPFAYFFLFFLNIDIWH